MDDNERDWGDKMDDAMLVCTGVLAVLIVLGGLAASLKVLL